MGIANGKRIRDRKYPTVADVANECLRCTGRGSSDPGNPGTFQEIHEKTKNLYPRNFEGGIITIVNKLSNHFRVDHTMTLSPVTPSGYKFGAHYEGTTIVNSNERYPSLSCNLMPNGNQTMSFVHTLGCRCRIKLQAQIAEKDWKSYNGTVEYRSDNCTLSMSLDDPNFFNLNGTLALHFLQSISSGLALGVEMACRRDETVGRQTLFTGAARYSTGAFTVSSTIGEAGLHVCCHRRASEQLEIGAEMEINLRTKESRGTIVYRLDVPRARFVFRGMIDSERTVSGVFEKKISDVWESSLLISAALNHKKEQFRVGIGLNVG